MFEAFILAIWNPRSTGQLYRDGKTVEILSAFDEDGNSINLGLFALVAGDFKHREFNTMNPFDMISPTQIILLGTVKVVLFSAIGIAVFVAACWVMVKIFGISPLSVRKEIEENQNIASGILYGSAFIALALIIGASIS